MKTVITYGTFDLLHTGHINLLKRAKKLGDRLIVGVTSDYYDQSRGKLNVTQSLVQRIENVRNLDLADLIIVEEMEGQKSQDIQQYNANIFAIGSDWIGKFDYLKDYCEVIYLERTKGVSSTSLRQAQNLVIHIVKRRNYGKGSEKSGKGSASIFLMPVFCVLIPPFFGCFFARERVAEAPLWGAK